MAHQRTAATPAKQAFTDTGMNPAMRETNVTAHTSLNEANSNATKFKSFMTPHKAGCAHVEDSDSEDDEHNGGGAKLTPQPRGAKSEKTIRFQDHDDYRVASGGASLSAPRPKPQALPFFQATRGYGRLVVSKHAGSESETDDDQSSNDGAETVAASHKTVARGFSDGTPNTLFSPTYMTTTPKTTLLQGRNAAKFIQTAPTLLGPRPESRGLTDAPPPAFDLEASLTNIVTQVIARATQSTPGSLQSSSSCQSPGLVNAQSVATQDVFQNRPAVGSAFNGSSDLFQQGSSTNVDVFRNNITSPGSVISSVINHGSISSGNGLSPAKFQSRMGCDVSWDDLLAQAREGFMQLNLPQVNNQPVTFNTGMPPSDMLNMLTSGFTTRPAFDLITSTAFEPFVPAASSRVPGPVNPVVKIDELPYEAKISDIIAFMGGNAKILNDADEPVHIMMERLTAKTGAAYVEFYDFDSAMKVVDKHRQSKAHGKPVRIGSRIVTVTISSQDQLLKDLFPYARGVEWRLGQPHIQVPPEEFKGFVTEEELIQLVKNVEFPHRVSITHVVCPVILPSHFVLTGAFKQVQYAKASPQRSVETLISILKKLPWHMTAYITIRQRYCVYKTVVDMLNPLQNAIHNVDQLRLPGAAFHQTNHHRHQQDDHQHARFADVLNDKLLKRLVRAAMGCPGFSPLMKDNIAFVSSLDERQIADYGVPTDANRWRHIYTLMPNPNVPGDVIEVCRRPRTSPNSRLTLGCDPPLTLLSSFIH
jgi:hypothetical protein